MKRVMYALLAFLVGIIFPVLIWVGLFVALREMGIEKAASAANPS